MAHEEDGGGVLVLGRPDVDDFGPQRLGRQGVHVAEGLVHEEDLRVHGKRPGHAHALLHAAGELPGIGVLKAGQAHHLDGLLGPFLDLLVGESRGTSRRSGCFP